MRWFSVRGLAAFSIHMVVSMATAWAADPKVPPGQDPGGVAVAIIGDGLDYVAPSIAARVARDGEGELIGWDFTDEDRRPFARAAGVDAVASIMIAESAARLISVRVAPNDEQQVARALRLVGETPAQIALLVAKPGSPIARENLRMAAQQLPQILIVVPARLAAPHSHDPSASGEAGGLLIVSAAGAPSNGDLVVEKGARSSDAGAAPEGTVHPDDIAAAKVAALAARLVAKEALPTVNALRARILGLSKEGPSGAKTVPGIDKLP